jgi:uncharacterized protein (DUF302 family)
LRAVKRAGRFLKHHDVRAGLRMRRQRRGPDRENEMNVAGNAGTAPQGASYGFECDVGVLPFQAVIARVTEALKAEGFGVLTEIDVQATMKAKLGIDVPAYRILGACNPPLAHRALSAEPEIGLLLPCNVVVREAANGHLIVGFMDPVAVLQMTGNAEVAKVAYEVRDRMQRVKAAVQSGHPA